MAAFVKSVEKFSITISGTSASANFTKSQTLADCIWLVTQRQDIGDDWDSARCDVYLASGPDRVQIDKIQGNGTLVLEVSVIELDTALVDVQQGTFQITAASGAGTAAVTAVTLAKAAAHCFWKTSSTQDDWDDNTVRVDFNSTTELGFSRQATDGQIDGHWWTIEAQNTEFSVQEKTFTIAALANSGTDSLTAVTTTRTFVIATYETTHIGDDAEDAATTVDLQNSTTVRANRDEPGSTNTNTVTAYVIEVESGSASVQRGTITQVGGVNTAVTAAITSVTVANSTTHSPVVYGCATNDGAASTSAGGSFFGVSFNSATEISAKRDGTAGVVDTDGLRWEVIEWLLQSALQNNITFALGLAGIFANTGTLWNSVSFRIGAASSRASTILGALETIITFSVGFFDGYIQRGQWARAALESLTSWGQKIWPDVPWLKKPVSAKTSWVKKENAVNNWESKTATKDSWTETPDEDTK